ncbi:hypothetical protein FQN60_012580 [Etheostoma spectabile]|uniref:Uncharacterized protein n=1 Tax=Etheostoma spectabile TaxID=54343 RepID=A0A5J5D9M1_9PERO|nr:hypothetical protein FQN60_005360 [Etheostoma spectabile]KAA8578902.1 hypothetical protein FQN60_006074 [Etheostoma spectabile]KAA8589011.1 hypothetical protein FQN60_010356 [Etheostoma spectabile]KAA8589215.1 hypothetical protein FQN60_012580 [Etheostoma spectabile]
MLALYATWRSSPRRPRTSMLF